MKASKLFSLFVEFLNLRLFLSNIHNISINIGTISEEQCMSEDLTSFAFLSVRSPAYVP
jgi:hypothetical protein